MKDDENKSAWAIELGLYPGILFGFRTYPEEHCTTHVLYVPFVDVAVMIYK
jgi:hypothetical protein